MTVVPGHDLQPTAEQWATIEAERDAGRLIVVNAEEGQQLYVPFGEGRAIPLTVEYSGTGPVAWRIVVQVIEGRARCVRLKLDAPPGGYLLTQTLRDIPLARLIEEALLMSAVELDADGGPVGEPIGSRVTSVSEARRLHKQIEREHRRRLRGTRRKGRVTDKDLEEVARVYRANGQTGNPTAAVHAHFRETGRPVSRATAGRWVGMARDRGYLGQAPSKGVAGERRGKPPGLSHPTNLASV